MIQLNLSYLSIVSFQSFVRYLSIESFVRIFWIHFQSFDEDFWIGNFVLARFVLYFSRERAKFHNSKFPTVRPPSGTT